MFPPALARRAPARDGDERALLQSLQPATELEEVITFARAAGFAAKTPTPARESPPRFSIDGPRDGRQTRGIRPKCGNAWRRRGARVWRRLNASRRTARRRVPRVRRRRRGDEISGRLLRTAKGLARAGEATQAQDMVNRAKGVFGGERRARNAAARRGIVARAESDGEIGARARRRADEAIARFRFPRPRVPRLVRRRETSGVDSGEHVAITGAWEP